MARNVPAGDVEVGAEQSKELWTSVERPITGFYYKNCYYVNRKKFRVCEL